MGGIATVAAAIGADLAARLPRQNKKQREGLALLVATALDVRDVNLMELAAALPRAAERLDMRYQWISRLLANPLIDTREVMAPFAREVLARARAQAHTLVLIIDQSQVNATHQMVMVSLRVGGRAVPLAWQVKNTQGAIGFAEQRAALDRVAALLPAGVRPVVMGDRFYGSPALIAWCQTQGWDWRLRLKQDLLVFEQGGESTLGECFARGEHLLSDIEVTEQRVRTHVAMVHEAGHPEPRRHRQDRPRDVPAIGQHGADDEFGQGGSGGLGSGSHDLPDPCGKDRREADLNLRCHVASGRSVSHSQHGAARPATSPTLPSDLPRPARTRNSNQEENSVIKGKAESVMRRSASKGCCE